MTELNRSVSLPLMVLYGLGTILGAGIYVLTGVVTERAGSFAPLSFLIAAVVASPTALAYAELTSRFPRSAAEAVYVHSAFGISFLTRLAGLGVATIGIISAATIARGFVGYLDVFIVLPDELVVAAVIVTLGALAIRGILASVIVAGIVTLVELSGLILVNVAGFDAMRSTELPLVPATTDWAVWSGVLGGAFLAFYAFIGFEDMANIAEETRNASRSLPIAIIICLVACTLIYGVTTFTATRSVPLAELAGSEAPMALVIERNSTFSPVWISLISLVAVVNGALIQMIMASRVLYGMSRLGQLPLWLGVVNERTKTPVSATILVIGLVLLLAIFFELAVLAEMTSSLTLLIFASVNLSLVVIKRKQRVAATINLPIALPIFGCLISLALFTARFIQN